MRRLLSLAALCCVVSFTGSLASPVGSLAGHVTDENDRPVAGARITVTGRGAVGVYHAITREDGLYQFVGIPTLEPLEITAQVEGKIPVTYSGMEVREGTTTWRDFRLRPAGAHDVLVLYDPSLPYHDLALDGIRSVLSAADARITEQELRGQGQEDLRPLRESLKRRFNAVIAIGSLAAHVARRESRDAPVVYTMVLDPGTEDLRRLNLCGLVLNGGFEEQLAVLQKLRPGARRIATIYDPRHLAGAVMALRRAGQMRGIQLATRPARNLAQIETALQSLADKPMDAFYFLLDPMLFDAAGFELVRKFTEGRGLILIVPDESFVAVGGTYAYAPGFREMGAYAARLVLHIFSGAAEPSGIKVTFPTARSLSLNPHEAQRLGLVIPDSWPQGGAGAAGGARGGAHGGTPR